MEHKNNVIEFPCDYAARVRLTIALLSVLEEKIVEWGKAMEVARANSL